IAMLYFSRWDSPESARAFAKLYADYVPKRYKHVNWAVACPSGPNVPVCNHTDAMTEQGRVVMEIRDNDLLIVEGYDEGVIERARDVLLKPTSLPASNAQSLK